MFRKEIKYTDYNGNERTETHYFNLNETELTKMELSINGGFTAYMDQLLEAQDTAKMMTIVDEIIDRSYGRKSLDGRLFEKSPEILAEFKSSEAYNKFFVETAMDQEKVTEFILGVMPNNFQEKMAEAAKAGVLGDAKLNESQKQVLMDAMAKTAGTASVVAEGTNNITEMIPADSQQ